MVIDFDKAKQSFEQYLDEFDREDDKIKLKIVHTYYVVDCAQEIAVRMKLSEEDIELAKFIGLLHDIGRFQQLKQFDSFMPDTMDHARYGAELLFGERRMIRQFLVNDKFDGIICEAISRHSDFKLAEIQDERTLLHARLIRDADKLDNCRVKLEEAMETLLGVSETEAGKGLISPGVWQSCMRYESILSAQRITKVDYWLSYVAQIFDVNFAATFSIIMENNYIPRIIQRLHYQERDTREKMTQLIELAVQYMERQL